VGEIHPDLFVEDLLHAKDLLEFVGLGHATFVAVGTGTRRPFCRKGVRLCEEFREKAVGRVGRGVKKTLNIRIKTPNIQGW
jgi:hypothetical protein